MREMVGNVVWVACLINVGAAIGAWMAGDVARAAWAGLAVLVFSALLLGLAIGNHTRMERE